METTKVCYGEHCFIAETAKTQAQRVRGLMFRKSLAKDRAMFFVFDSPGVHNFWMKNCLIPLDIIFLDENYKVVAIKPNNQPCQEGEECLSINPNVLAKYVLEINAGLASQIGLVVGSQFIVKP
ncbi:MAG: DUF192 domain-containing protein [Candidatus Pacebacteria bacterium]|nr:DUF192 domain-containing protein [Candidatus Paceibacterota bacterium]